VDVLRTSPPHGPDRARDKDPGAATLAVLLDRFNGRLSINVEEAGAVVGLGRTASYDAVRRGDIPARRIGTRLVVSLPALARWLEAVTPERDAQAMSSDRRG